MQALHDMDIIHCDLALRNILLMDLALRNILLTADDHVRISDLGVAYDAPQGGLLSAILMKNRFFLVPGAKEAPAKVEFDKPSDCWTLGYCASLMVCKELPSVPCGIRLRSERVRARVEDKGKLDWPEDPFPPVWPSA